MVIGNAWLLLVDKMHFFVLKTWLKGLFAISAQYCGIFVFAFGFVMGFGENYMEYEATIPGPNLAPMPSIVQRLQVP